MKKILFSILTLTVGLCFTGCADFFDEDTFRAGNPNRGPEYDYLNDYADLKDYVDHNKYPNFKLGGGTDAASFNNQGLDYALSLANFEELVTGNSFKYASIVDKNGDMNFSTVQDFTNLATENEKSVYGHTLVWHSQQNLEYLNALIADKKVVPVKAENPFSRRVKKAEGKIIKWEEVIVNGDLEGDDVSCFFTTEPTTGGPNPSVISDGAGKDGSRGIKVVSADGAGQDDWATQFFIKIPDAIKTGTNIRVEFDYKASLDNVSADTQAHTTPGNYKHWACIGSPTFGTAWKHFVFEGKSGAEWTDDFQTIAFNLAKNKKMTTFYFDNISFKVGKEVKVEHLVTNGDMEGDDVSCFFTTEPTTGGPHASTIVDGVGVDGSRGVKLVSADGASQDDWATQFFIRMERPIAVGTKLHVEFDYKADKAADCDTQSHGEPGNYIHWACVGSPTFTTEWKHLSADITTDASMTDNFQTIAFNLAKNKKMTTFYFDNVVIYTEKGGDDPIKYWEEQLKNGDLEGSDVSCFFTTEPTSGGPHASTIFDGVGMDGSRGIKLVSADGAGQDDWATQFFIRVPKAVPVGSKIKVSFDYRSSIPGDCDTQTHSEPGSYIHYMCIGSPSFTPAWQHYESVVTTDASMTDAFQSVAFNLAKNKKQTEFYFDNISFMIEKESGGTIPLTPEEKRDTLTWALTNWINGMMDAVGDKVKAWDLVNEPMSDAEPYKLKSGDREGGENNFYWQDYLGENYGRVAAQIVRKHANGKDAKLFVNDYNLEYNLDKCKGLIAMIDEWEADVNGEDKITIDGIGTQMHVSYKLNPTEQDAQEKRIVEMFKLLAATGKYVRVSELDMGIADAEGHAMMTADINKLDKETREAYYHKMADFYKFIVEKYLEIIPVNQQWGICVWGVTDSPAGSGWRAGEPVGLWDEGYYRKHAYAGFADGLAGE